MKEFLQFTAWKIDKPLPFGFSHITILFIGITLSLFASYRLRHVKTSMYYWILGGTCLVLLILEAYKQLFHFYLLDQQQYDWWIFPFQLCSLPMYIGLLIPFFNEQHRIPLETFLMDFSLLGAIAALLFPYDLMHTYVMLTIHAFLWHFLLLFISFFIGFHKQGATSTKGYFQTLPLLFIFIAIATFLNITFHTKGEINMFYISPYYESTQPFFNLLTPILGIHIRNLSYIVCMIIGAWLIHLFWRKVQQKIT